MKNCRRKKEEQKEDKKCLEQGQEFLRKSVEEERLEKGAEDEKKRFELIQAAKAKQDSKVPETTDTGRCFKNVIQKK